jgi:hypothetical protein
MLKEVNYQKNRIVILSFSCSSRLSFVFGFTHGLMVMPLAAGLPVFLIFLALFSKDFLKYVSDGKISGNRLRTWRHPRWR